MQEVFCKHLHDAGSLLQDKLTMAAVSGVRPCPSGMQLNAPSRMFGLGKEEGLQCSYACVGLTQAAPIKLCVHV